MDLQLTSAQDFPALYEILCQSFPIAEYRSLHNQQLLLKDSRYLLYTNDTLSLYLGLWQFPDFIFIEHFALLPTMRSQGLGTAYLRQIVENAPQPVILEAELPDTPIAARRLNFYLRNGFTVNPYSYTQPSYGAGREAVPMAILSTQPLSPAQMHCVQDTLYRFVYKCI